MKVFFYVPNGLKVKEVLCDEAESSFEIENNELVVTLLAGGENTTLPVNIDFLK